MITLTVAFDTQCFREDDFRQLMHGGRLLDAVALLNLRWDEFSALDVARSLGLTDVVWDAVRDDTPGTLTCIIGYETRTRRELKELLPGLALDYYEMSAAD